MWHSRSKKVIFIPIIVLAVLFLVSWVVMLLWNNILPDVFGLRVITYWQAMGILILSKILFSSKPGRPGWGRHHMWEKKLREQFANMTPEERSRFKEEFKQRAKEWYRNPGWHHQSPFGHDRPFGPVQPGEQPNENNENNPKQD